MGLDVWLFFKVILQRPYIVHASKNIRIQLEYEDGIEKSVWGISDYYQEACQVMTNTDPEGWNFLTYPHTINRYFSCVSLDIAISYLGLDSRKPVFGGLRTTKAQTSCTSAQTDQRLCHSFFGKYHIKTCDKRNFIFLASLCSC